jgi:hypothetical protein
MGGLTFLMQVEYYSKPKYKDSYLMRRIIQELTSMKNKSIHSFTAMQNTKP